MSVMDTLMETYNYTPPADEDRRGKEQEPAP